MDISEIGIVISLISVSVAVLRLNNKGKKNNPTNELDKRYKRIDLCDEIHKGVSEKLDCIPEIKDTVIRLETKMNILINGK